MDIRLMDSSEIPLPPEEVRWVELAVEPYPDGHRLKLRIRVTPFQERPNFEIRVLNPDAVEVANISIIESMEPTIELTAHLRGDPAPGPYWVHARLEYPDHQLSSETQASFVLQLS